MSTNKPEWIPVFTGLSVRQFEKSVRIVAGRGGTMIADGVCHATRGVALMHNLAITG